MTQDELTKKWLNNELSPAEKIKFEDLEDAKFNQYIVDFAANFRTPETYQLSSFETFQQNFQASNEVKPLQGYSAWLKIASVIIIALGIFYFTVLHAPMTSISTLANEMNSINLPDKSFVKLNENSILTYNEKKWNEKRELNLSGEAYFDVEKGKKFDVKTEMGTVSVLGTEFNVYSNDGTFNVTCYEGLVSVSFNEKNIELPAGTEMKISEGSFEKIAVNIVEPQWLKKLSVFENEPIENVIFELEKHYNINIVYSNTKSIKFSGAFENNNLQNALKSITEPFNLNFTILNESEVEIKYSED